MKKILISFFVVLLLISNTHSYTATNKDTILINKISNKIEEVIESKGEKYRNIFIERLEKIKSKTNKERLIFIIDEIISGINNVEDELGGLFDNLDSEEEFSNKLKCAAYKEDIQKYIKDNYNDDRWSTLDELFYSPKMNSCLFVIRIDIYKNNNDFSLRIVEDYLSNTRVLVTPNFCDGGKYPYNHTNNFLNCSKEKEEFENELKLLK